MIIYVNITSSSKRVLKGDTKAVFFKQTNFVGNFDFTTEMTTMTVHIYPLRILVEDNTVKGT